METETKQWWKPMVALAHRQSWSSSAQYIVLDIETGNAPAKFIQDKIDQWQPPKGWVDEEKIEKKRAENEQKERGKGALLDNAPILCLAVATENSRIIFNGMDDKNYDIIDGIDCIGCGDEKSMLSAIAQWANSIANEETVLAGHNILGFDLPKLRSAYLRYRLPIPQFLKPAMGDSRNQPTFDIQPKFSTYFTTQYKGNPFISFDKVCKSLGIETPKSIMNGAMVPIMHEQGLYEEILSYCCLDVQCEREAFLLMSSNLGG